MRGDGSSNEERLRSGRKYRTDRTEGISDGVFAVSLTLLILDVRPPEGGVSQLVHGLVLIAPRLGTFALSFAACTSTLAGVWFVADHSHMTEQPTPSQRRYIVRRFGVQLMVALLGIACAFLAPALALSIFVALPIVFALTYHRRYY